jgi:cytochrome P450
VLPRGGGEDGQSPVFVPRGAAVIYCVYAMHRRRDLFGADADAFRPERWAPDAPEGPLRPGWAYLPFNGGPRICVGQQFALTNAGYTTVRILQTFAELENRDPEPWIEQLGVTLASRHGTKVGLTPR